MLVPVDYGHDAKPSACLAWARRPLRFPTCVRGRRPPTFPKGAVIRTILKDYAPEELAGGATLFHEHMSLAPDFLPRWIKFAAETRAANGLPTRPAGRTGRRHHRPRLRPRVRSSCRTST